MASFTINPNPKARKFVEPIGVWASQSVSSSSSSSSSSSPSSPPPPPQSRRGLDRLSRRFLDQNQGNFGRSGCPVRVMFYRSGMWADYPAPVVESLRWCFSARKSVVDLVLGESNCVFDFLRMLQIDLSSGNRRSIAWIDERGACFFPKEFVAGEFEDSSENQRIDIEIQVQAGSEPTSGKRMREIGGAKVEEDEKEVTSSFRTGDSPKRRRLESPGWPNVKLLSEGDKGFTGVRDIALTGIRRVHPGAVITAIHQCTRVGPMAKAQRAVFAKQMEITAAARGAANMVYAWLSALAEVVSEVLTNGFGVSNKGGVRLSAVNFPCGSPLQSVEADDDGEKHLILCAVILGNVEKLEAGSQQRYPSSAEFDTGADDPKNPKWYLVWPTNLSRHILPECVVSYKSRVRFPAKLEGLTRTKYSFTELFAKLKSCVSSAKFQQCITLYKTLKAGKISKDLFIKRFRVVAGEKVLLSAIWEICGAV